jgi:type II secretion system protein G
MLTRLRNRQKGFTLIELLIVVAIIGIIAALLIPNFLDSLQKAKQKRTVADIRNTGTAWMSWLTDIAQAAAAGRAATPSTYTMPSGGAATAAAVASFLETRYIQKVPDIDAWKNSYAFRQATNPLASDTVMAMGSGGNKGTSQFTPATSYTVTAFDPTDYAQDIIWGDGFFIRWPQKLS